MNQSDETTLGRYVQRQRQALGLSIRGLAAAAGVDSSGLSRVERGLMNDLSPAYLHKLARALEVDPTDLYLMAGYTEAKRLPAFAPYLRAKYELPEEAVEQVQAFFDFVNAKYVKAKGKGDHNEDSN